jgi:hypothetical protein
MESKLAILCQIPVVGSTYGTSICTTMGLSQQKHDTAGSLRLEGEGAARAEATPDTTLAAVMRGVPTGGAGVGSVTTG